MKSIQWMVPFVTALTLAVPAYAAGSITLKDLERMTPAQLQGLTQDQIGALDLEANRMIDSFVNTLKGPQPGPKWPNADVTMYLSSGVTDEGYERDVYKSYAGPDWTSDGCSFPVAAMYKKAFDTQACRHHDFGYRNVAQYRQGRNEAMRQIIDLRLLLDMRYQCLTDDVLSVKQHDCDLAAVAAYVQARKTGKALFDAVPARYP